MKTVRPLRLGLSIATALTLGATTVVTPNVTPQAQAAGATKTTKTIKVPGKGRAAACYIYQTKSTTSPYAGYSSQNYSYASFSSGCYGRTAVYCSNGGTYGSYYYSSNPSIAYCPTGTYAIYAYAQVTYPYVSYWYYF